jgi:hypothetical protein
MAIATAILDTFADERPRVADDGLIYGATVAKVGEALGGFDRDEVTRMVTDWADRENDAGRLSDAEYLDLPILLLRRRGGAP